MRSKGVMHGNLILPHVINEILVTHMAIPSEDFCSMPDAALNLVHELVPSARGAGSVVDGGAELAKSRIVTKFKGAERRMPLIGNGARDFVGINITSLAP